MSEYIPRLVLAQFPGPKLGIRLWHSRKLTRRMPMPKASMNEDHFAFSDKGQVRASRKSRIVEAITVSHRKDEFPDRQFRLRVLPADTAHVFAAFEGAEVIHKVKSR